MGRNSIARRKKTRAGGKEMITQKYIMLLCHRLIGKISKAEYEYSMYYLVHENYDKGHRNYQEPRWIDSLILKALR